MGRARAGLADRGLSRSADVFPALDVKPAYCVSLFSGIAFPINLPERAGNETSGRKEKRKKLPSVPEIESF